MPSTFSHPLAALALHRLSGCRLHFPALVIGSMSPDFGYYVGQFLIATFAHTILGTVAFCLPASLVVLAMFYFLRPSLCFILPQPHRSALTPLLQVSTRFDLRKLFNAAVSALLGAWSHTIWDSFTHSGAWSVEHLPILGKPLFHVGDTVFLTSYVLQQLSTFGAGVALVVIYIRWLRRQPAPTRLMNDTSSDRWRYLLFGAVALFALAVAVPAALGMASSYVGYTAVRVLLFRTCIYFAAVFLPLITLTAFLIYRVHQRTVLSEPSRSSQLSIEKVEEIRDSK